MILKISKFIIASFFTLYTINSTACTIFMINDGQNVWIGNNEDEVFSTKYRLWYFPAKQNAYGYMLWTELRLGKLFNGLMHKYPQGGLNEFGLFMDYTAIDKVPITNEPNRNNRKKELVNDILKSCKTVNEAISFIEKYNLIKLTEAQLFIADATGDYATVHGGYIVRKSENNFALTNYCINNGHKEACYRRDVATKYLRTNTSYKLEDIKNILQKSTQKPPQTLITNYSMAIDLRKGIIHLYYKNDFTIETTINLNDELKKGKRHKDMIDYFPKDIASVIEKRYEDKGIDEAVALYKELRNSSENKFNFKNNSVINLSIKWIDNNKVKEAIALLETLKEYAPTNKDIFTWLGVAYKKDNNLTESNKNFSKVLEQNPNDYLATLWGRQVNQKVVFKLNDFEGAEQVSLIGDFSQGRKNAIKMIKIDNYWFCEVELPKGEITYKFWVNNENLTDKINLMYEGTGANTFSKVYVW